jgi:hypothetical protein
VLDFIGSYLTGSVIKVMSNQARHCSGRVLVLRLGNLKDFAKSQCSIVNRYLHSQFFYNLLLKKILVHTLLT